MHTQNPLTNTHTTFLLADTCCLRCGVHGGCRLWLFISYVVSFAAVAGSVWVLLGKYALDPDVPTIWPGIAGLFQVMLKPMLWPLPVGYQ